MPHQKGAEEAQAAVLAAHDTFWQSYARRDLDARFAVCAEDVTFFGTGQFERAIGREQYRAMNQKGVEQYPAAFTIDMLWIEVRVLGEVAWTECDTLWVQDHDGVIMKDLIRQTTILHHREGAWLVVHVHGSEPDYRLKEGEYMTNGRIMARNKELEGLVAERTRQLAMEKKRSDDLLLNILPAEVAEELKNNGQAAARHFQNVTVLFTDFKDFTSLAEQFSASALVEELNVFFKAFDAIITAHGIEKIKTIGDAYMCVGGLPDTASATTLDVVQAALEMQAFARRRKAERVASGLLSFEMRIGIHTGSVVAGIVGVKKFQYDIWGDTVNIASRMESSSEVGRVNLSGTTFELVRNTPGLSFTPRGKVQAKGKGALEMYFVDAT